MNVSATVLPAALCALMQMTPCAALGDTAAPPWLIGGVGGAYLLAAPGELEIEVYKRDLDVRNLRSDLRAILAGPDREVQAEAVIPASPGSAGDPIGPVQSAVLRATVTRPGIYALNITTKGDRYGLNVAWGMRTNAVAYVVETSRGHRDERHQEPIVLLDADRPADICFLPRQGAFGIEVEGLPAGVESLVLYDADDVEVQRIPVVPQPSTAIRQYLRVAAGKGPEGSAQVVVPATVARGGRPWRLQFPRGKAFVNIDGVTRWEGGDAYRDLSVWSPDRRSWFPFLEHRWLVTPYQRTVHAEPGAPGRMAFQVHNNAAEPRVVALSLEFPGEPWPAGLSTTRVALGAGEAKEVMVSFTTPPAGAAARCHLRATPEQHPETTTYATLTVHGGEAPASRPLDLPLVLRPYAHENRLLGYLPDYPLDAQVYFDRENRPHVVTSRHLHRRIDGNWVTTDVSAAVTRSVPAADAASWSVISTKVGFDADNHVYLLGRSGNTVALLHSADGGQAFTAYALPGREDEPRSWDIEQFSGHNVPHGPPPVVRLARTHRDSESRLRWRSTNDLDLFVGTKRADGSIAIGEPLRVSNASLGFSLHSGIPSAVVSRGAKVHVVWGEATDPAVSREQIPGVPAYVATYDRDTGVLGKPVFMSFGPPPNDGHNTPSITMDSQGYLHVVVGTHGAPFQYLRSLQPNDAYAGWTEAGRTSTANLGQTYVGLVCGADDTLHLVFRLWRAGEAHLDGASWAALAYQRKLRGQDWEEPRILVAPPMSEYSIYYHRLTVDQTGSLFLSYDYWSTMWFYRNDQRGAVAAGSGRPGRGWGRAVLTSGDNGETWRLW